MHYCKLSAKSSQKSRTQKNFSFLKDPVIVNSIFLKKAERIEVLGLVLLISLLIWRLMECSMLCASMLKETTAHRSGGNVGR